MFKTSRTKAKDDNEFYRIESALSSGPSSPRLTQTSSFASSQGSTRSSNHSDHFRPAVGKRHDFQFQNWDDEDSSDYQSVTTLSETDIEPLFHGHVELEKTNNMRGWMTILSGILAHLVIGNEYLWGNINSYVISYFHSKGDPKALQSEAIIVLPLQMLVMTCVNPIGAYLQKRYNPKILMNVGFCLVLGGTYIAANVANTWQTFVLFYGVVQPIGYGLLFWTPILCAWEWFEDRKGLATGLILGAFGLAPSIFGILTTAIVNPNNEALEGKYFGKSVSSRVPLMFDYCLLIWTFMAILSTCLISRNPKYTAKAKQQESSDAITVSQALRTSEFWIIGLMMYNGIFFGIYIASVYKSVALDTLSDKALTFAGVLAAIGNGSSRVIWSSLQDKFGFKQVYYICLILQFLTALLMYPSRIDKNLYTFFVVLAMVCEGGSFSMFPTFVVNTFGIENGGQIFTYMFFCVPLSAISSAIIVSQYQAIIGIESIFLLGAFLTLINMIMLFFIDEKKIKNQQKSKNSYNNYGTQLYKAPQIE